MIRSTLHCQQRPKEWFSIVSSSSSSSSSIFVSAFQPSQSSSRRRHTWMDQTPNRLASVSSSLSSTFPQVRYRHDQVPSSATTTKTTTSLNVATKEDTFSSDYDFDSYINHSGYSRPVVQWYPGHIAKAERQLAETLKVVDVVVEVRDARACKATSHPSVGEWCAGKPRIVALTHVDAIPKRAERAWKASYEQFGAERGDVIMGSSGSGAQITNQAKQLQATRQQYSESSSSSSSSTSKKNRPSNKQSKQQQQQQQQSSHASAITPVEQVLFVNAKQGQGIHGLHRAIWNAGSHVQERREKRGLKERPLRVGVIGYPNVGKSALLNKLLGRKRARTANTPGVTRSLQWIRVKDPDMNQYATNTKNDPNSKTTVARKKKEFEILDSPGIIPAKMVDQSDALLLAACNCIGQAAYDNQGVAAHLFDWLKATHLMGKGDVTSPHWRTNCLQRYGFDPLEEITNESLLPLPSVLALDHETTSHNNHKKKYIRTGEDMLFQVAENTCRGNPEDAARKMLQDFRTGRLGPMCLQIAPEVESDPGHVVPIGTTTRSNFPSNEQEQEFQQQLYKQQELQERQQRAKAALEIVKERGIGLPPSMFDSDNTNPSNESTENFEVSNDNANDHSKSKNDDDDDDIGKGLFDGW